MKNLEIKESARRLLSLFLILVTVGGTQAKGSNQENKASIVATQVTKEIKKVHEGINIYIDDHTFVAQDANKNIVEATSINGSTYLPFRAIAEALGATVSWDGQTNTASIVTANKKVVNITPFRLDKPLTEKTVEAVNGINVTIDGQPYYFKDANGNLVELFSINGTTYAPVRGVAEALGVDVTWDGMNNRVYLGKHVEQKNPSSWSNKWQIEGQKMFNVMEISGIQVADNTFLLQDQFIKYQAMMDEMFIISKKLDDNFYSELNAFHVSIVEDYRQLLSATSRYTIEDAKQILEVTEADKSSIANFTEQGNINILSTFKQSYDSINVELCNLLSLCTDEKIDSYYAKIRGILNRYQMSLVAVQKTDKTYSIIYRKQTA